MMGEGRRLTPYTMVASGEHSRAHPSRRKGLNVGRAGEARLEVRAGHDHPAAERGRERPRPSVRRDTHDDYRELTHARSQLHDPLVRFSWPIPAVGVALFMPTRSTSVASMSTS